MKRRPPRSEREAALGAVEEKLVVVAGVTMSKDTFQNGPHWWLGQNKGERNVSETDAEPTAGDQALPTRGETSPGGLADPPPTQRSLF